MLNILKPILKSDISNLGGRSIVYNASKRFLSDIIKTDLKKYQALIKEHNLQILKSVEPPVVIAEQDLKALNITSKDNSTKKIVKNYTTITKFFITSPRVNLTIHSYTKFINEKIIKAC